MTINFLREEKVTITYNSTFDETDFEEFCETNNIPTENLTFEECVKVVCSVNTTATVEDADGDKISIYYCLRDYMRDKSYSNHSEYHDVHGMPFESMLLELDGNEHFEDIEFDEDYDEDDEYE